MHSEKVCPFLKKNIGQIYGINVLMDEYYAGLSEFYSFIKKMMDVYFFLPYESEFQFVAGIMFVGNAYLFDCLKKQESHF